MTPHQDLSPRTEPLPAFSTETARLDFPEPLSAEHQRIIELLTERYQGRDGGVFMTISREGTTTLIVPKAGVQRISYDDTKNNEPQHSQA